MAVGSWEKMLQARPVRNLAARIEREGEDEVAIAVKQTRPRYLVAPLSWIVPHRPERLTRLDRLGAEVWRLCDGTRRVEDIVERFAAAHGLSFHESRIAVTEYIGSLLRRGVLAIAIPDAD